MFTRAASSQINDDKNATTHVTIAKWEYNLEVGLAASMLYLQTNYKLQPICGGRGWNGIIQSSSVFPWRALISNLRPTLLLLTELWPQTKTCSHNTFRTCLRYHGKRWEGWKNIGKYGNNHLQSGWELVFILYSYFFSFLSIFTYCLISELKVWKKAAVLY